MENNTDKNSNKNSVQKTFKVLFVFATEMEMRGVFPYLKDELKELDQGIKVIEKPEILYAITGIGAPQTAMNLTNLLLNFNVSVIVNLGICGLYPKFIDQHKIGDVVRVKSDYWADLGVEDAEGKFKDAKDLAWSQSIKHSESLLDNDYNKVLSLIFKSLKAEQNTEIIKEKFANLISVSANTVNQATGTESTSLKRSQKYSTEVESMEGAAIFMVAEKFNVPALQFRAISNIASIRDLSKWEIALALENLRNLWT